MPFLGLATYADFQQMETKIMSALTDLQAAEASLETAVAAAVADIKTLTDELASLPSVSDADAAVITGKLNTLATNLSNVVNPPAPTAA